MSILSLVFIVLILALVGAALYEHFDTTSLSLPLSPTPTFLVILLVLLAAINAIYLPRLLRLWKSGLPATALQVFQLVFTTILGTLFFQSIIPSTSRLCQLENEWRRLWMSHNAEVIRRIQDTLQCCGFRTVQDMAWPFPRGSDRLQATCDVQFARTLACRVPWEQALQRNSSIGLGIVLAVAVLQLTSYLRIGRQYTFNEHRPRTRVLPQIANSEPNDEDPESAHPLMRALEHGDEDEEYGVTETDETLGEDRRYNGAEYGAIGPRVEPLPITGNPWGAETRA